MTLAYKRITEQSSRPREARPWDVLPWEAMPCNVLRMRTGEALPADGNQQLGLGQEHRAWTAARAIPAGRDE